MKDGIICGIILGMLAGAMLYKHSPCAKEIVNTTENVVMEEIKNMTNTSQKKSN